MAPLMPRQPQPQPQPPSSSPLLPRTTTPVNPLTWAIVAVVIVAAAALVALVAHLVLDRRRSHGEYRNALARDPYLTRREFARRRKMSPLQRAEEEEAQRRVMIRKSLASRTDTQSSLGTPKPVATRRGSMDSARSNVSSLSSLDIPPLPAFFPSNCSVSINNSLPRRGRRDHTTTTATATTEWAGASVPSLSISWAPNSMPPSRYGSRVALRDEWKEWEAGVERDRSRDRQDSSSDDDDMVAIDVARGRRRRSSGGGGDIVIAPQLPRLPSFEDLNEDWRKSTGPGILQQQLQQQLQLQLQQQIQQQQHQQQPRRKHGRDPEMSQGLATLARAQMPAAFLHPLLRKQSQPQLQQ